MSTEPNIDTDRADSGTTESGVAREPDDLSDHLATLRGIAQRPLGEHADAYTEVHARLQSALTDIDDAAG